MSLDSPESPEEAGAAARSPSPDTTYKAEEEADMLLNQAETGAVEEPVEVKAESPVYVAQGLSPGCRHELQNPSPDSRSRSMTPEDRGRSPTMQERMTRGPRVDNLERTRLNGPGIWWNGRGVL